MLIIQIRQSLYCIQECSSTIRNQGDSSTLGNQGDSSTVKTII